MDTVSLVLIAIAFFVGVIIAWKYKYSLGDTFALLAALFISIIIVSLLISDDRDKETEKLLMIVGGISFIYLIIWTFYTLAKKY